MSAAFFAMEVISVGIMHYSALVPCAVASVTAAYLSRLLGIAPARFSVSGIPSVFSIPTMLRVFAALRALRRRQHSVLRCFKIYVGILCKLF